MTEDPGDRDDDRRRRDRRGAFVRLADYTIPEVRKALITTALLLSILALFVYMVRDVVVAVIAGVVLAVYLVPFQQWAERHLRSRTLTAIVVIVLVIVPLVAILAYSWVEISHAAGYLSENRADVAARMTTALQRLPFLEGVVVQDDLSRWVAAAANQSTEIVDEIQGALDILVLSVSVFLFTVFYVLTDHAGIARYIVGRVPGRYRPLMDRIQASVSTVAYGALYATFLTQILKAGIVLAMNLIWDVPLALVLAIAAFFIGFLPVVGSWSVYLPVAIYLMVFRDNVVGGVLMLLIGLLGNTILVSMYLRPKIAAEKSGELNFYWMFIALVTGVYTFGLVGIIIGPILIGLLKAVFESITGDEVPELADPALPAP